MRSLAALLACALACGGGHASQSGSDAGAGSDGGALAQPDAGTVTLADGGTCTTQNGAPSVGGCALFPSDDEWNRDVSCDEVDPNSAAYLADMAPGAKLHPDFGSDPTYGIPFATVGAGQAQVPMAFDYADQSDPGPYPIPANAPIEGGANSTGDRHVLIVDTAACLLYETWDSHYVGPGWHCGSGAKFDLRSNALRPDGWTSADAAGLAILPGLVRYDEAAAGQVSHALRFTMQRTQRAYIHPATHYASSITDPNYPPMGLRVRLKANFDTSGFHGLSKAILGAMQRYGMLLADNGSNWYVSGATDSRWDDDDLNQIKTVPASAFEVVKVRGAIYK